MASDLRIRVPESGTAWWRRYAERIHRSVEELEDIVRVTGKTPQRFPHVRTRIVNEEPDTFVLGTGLSIWEIAWLARCYGSDPYAIARHTLADPALVEEGLRYTAERPDEVEIEIQRHTEVALEDLQAMLPGIRVVTVDIDGDDCPVE